MSNTGPQVSQASSGTFDLSQFYQVFFEEAGENLASMENTLLAIDVGDPVEDDLHAIFRAAHSIKGGAATFGFQDVTELTHELETLLDRVRKRELAMTTEMINMLLEAGDVLKGQLAGHQAGGAGETENISDLLSTIRKLAGGKSAGGSGPPEARAKPADGMRTLDMVIGPVNDASVFDSIVELFADIPDLGRITPVEGAEGVPGEGLRRFRVVTKSPDDELCDLFGFHVGRDQVRFIRAAPPPADEATSQVGRSSEPHQGGRSSDPDCGISAGTHIPPAPRAAAAASEEAAPSAQKYRRRADDAAEATTLRVSIDKVDQLINLVGELLITQAMLSTNGRDVDPIVHAGILSGLADLERSTRNLQEAVMGIRMIPMAIVFNRFPRMLRDLTARLGKEIELKTSGEATELDKGLIEKITDPLTHLIRNAIDHGIEMPDKRIASGKAARGTIFLSASHRGGSIVIEVRDDGAGLNRNKILAKARQQGLAVHDGMTDKEVWNLIWAPGFSTAEQVTDVSGRGVGMDVVTKNINALGGTVDLESAEGYGTRVSVRLPLTLAIMDGMSVAVNGEIFIIPLSSVIESLQVTEGMLRKVAEQKCVVEVRADYLPVVALHEVFNAAPPKAAMPGKILVIIEFEGAKTALLVDELIGQHQVVVKNLEANYRKVPGVSGATIMGDGRVALILDVAQVVATGHSAAGATASASQLKH